MTLSRARVAIVGLGLMGGSLAAALSDNQVCREVIGVARRQWPLDQALKWGWIDRGTLDLREGLRSADIVVLATPVRTIIHLLYQIGPWLKAGCLLMDLGSTKRQVVAAMTHLPPVIEPVGGHPMCGKEFSGLEAAEPDLYKGATFVLTPLARTSPAALELAQGLVRSVGAHPLILEADQHDRLVGTISHLPYCLAAVLVQTAEEIGVEDNRVWKLAASGFRDTSRLAASDVTMTRDILLTNREVVADLLRRSRRHIDRWLTILERGDESALEQAMEALCSRRRSLFHEDNL